MKNRSIVGTVTYMWSLPLLVMALTSLPVFAQPPSKAEQLAYVTNFTSTTAQGTVSVINTATNTPHNGPAVGNGPVGIAITPDGTEAWVVNQFSGSVSVIDTGTNTVSGSPMSAGVNPEAIAIANTSNGTVAYVADEFCCIYGFGGTSFVNVINTTTKMLGTPIPVGVNARGVAVTPDGTRAYVTNFSSHTVSVIDTSTHQVITTITGITGFGTTVPGGFVGPFKVAITPDGTRVYVTSFFTNSVSVIDNTATPFPTLLSGPSLPIPAGSGPVGVAITHDGAFAYVTNLFDNSVSVLCTDSASVSCQLHTAVATITTGIGVNPVAVATTPQGAKAYVANAGSNNVSVICADSTSMSCTFNTVGPVIGVGVSPQGVAIKPRARGHGAPLAMDQEHGHNASY